MDQAIANAVANREIAGVVLMAGDRTGALDFQRCYGRRGRDPRTPLLSSSTCMAFDHATKLITSIACLQGVERGVLQLDHPISEHLPELAKFPVLAGFGDDGKPQFRRPKRPITLRHLLSHSSGLAYDATHPMLVRYRGFQGIKPPSSAASIEERFSIPLVYDPGEGWSDGPGVDWAGKALERATGTTLDEYIQQHVCAPLGIRQMTFRPWRHLGMSIRRPMTPHSEDGDSSSSSNPGYAGETEAGERDNDEEEYSDSDSESDESLADFGGSGLYTSPDEFFKILRTLLNNDSRLLQPSTVELLFSPQLNLDAISGMMQSYEDENIKPMMAHLIPARARKNHSLGGSLVMEDFDGVRYRRKGAMIWGGLPNIVWTIDRDTGMATLYVTQV